MQTLSAPIPAETESSPVDFVQLRPEHIDGAVHCLAQSFLDEPMVNLIGLSYEGLAAFVRPRLEITARDGLSWLTLENGKVVSVILNDDNTLGHVPFENEDEWMPKLSLILGLLDRLHDESPAEKALLAQERKFLHLFMGGTLREARKKGYLKRLLGLSLAHAAEHGFEVAMAEATSPASQHSCRSMGLQTVHRLVYQDIPGFEPLEQTALELQLLRLLRLP